MFGAKYSRLEFWIISIGIFIINGIIVSSLRFFLNIEDNDNPLYLSFIPLIFDFFLINVLSNRIRDYGHNPWIALFSLIPLVWFGFAIYYGIANKKQIPLELDTITSLNNNNDDEVTRIHNYKYIENEFIANDTKNHTDNEIYENIMNEIEQNNKVKSAWAKALSQSDGNKDKAESLYIKIRFEELNNKE